MVGEAARKTNTATTTTTTAAAGHGTGRRQSVEREQQQPDIAAAELKREVERMAKREGKQDEEGRKHNVAYSLAGR